MRLMLPDLKDPDLDLGILIIQLINVLIHRLMPLPQDRRWRQLLVLVSVLS